MQSYCSIFGNSLQSEHIFVEVELEKMTKERLESYRSNKMEILELDYILENRWKSDTMIGNDVIFDYSKGYPMSQSVTGFDYKRYERLQDRDLRRKKNLELECKEIDDFVDGIQDSLTRRIFRIYFIDGRKSVTQREVASHTSQDDWTPAVSPSLFAKVLIPDANVIPEWEQPESTNPYMAGDKVTHNGKTWESLVDNNVWEPGATGTEGLWKEVE
ncbi:MAG: hypothetical protein Q4B75_09290 [Eubacteriales bacterium]|nr:hypothetical protein [Eubacteriales bacterium]